MLHALSALLLDLYPILVQISSLDASGAIFCFIEVYLIYYSGNKFYLLSATGTSMRKVSAVYFLLTYFIAELFYAIYSLYDNFRVSAMEHFTHVGIFISGAIIVGIFKATKGSSHKKK